jgi:bacterial microcompartment shell protein
VAVLGMVEYKSIAIGIRASDVMVKAAPVELLESHPIDPGKYLSAVTGDVASVQASVSAGVADAGAEQVVYHLVLPNVHEQILPALRREAPIPEIGAVGVIETSTAAAIVDAADAACKAAPVNLARLHLALRIGGKGFTTVVGDVADVEAAVSAGADAAGAALIERVVIPNPYPEIYAQLTSADDAWHRDAS